MENTSKININEMGNNAESSENEQSEEVLKLKNELLIALADIENLRKRHLKEKEDLSKFILSSALTDLAGPFENLFSALKVQIPEDLSENTFVKSVLEGVTMVQKEFEKVFNKLGLKRLFPEGEKFNPNFHQAVAQVEENTKEEGTVATVVSAGFELNGRVIRPAMVVVVKSK